MQSEDILAILGFRLFKDLVCVGVFAKLRQVFGFSSMMLFHLLAKSLLIKEI